MENHKNEAGNVTKGIMYICDVLKEVAQIFESQQKCQEPYYEMPRFIYRGISMFYPYWDVESKGELHPSTERVKNDYIRSGLSLKMHRNSEIRICPAGGLAQNGYIRINYINTLENLVRNAKKH